MGGVSAAHPDVVRSPVKCMAPTADPIRAPQALPAAFAARCLASVRRFRLSFLAKFALLTLLVTAASGAGLSYFLVAEHEAAVEADVGVTAAGEVAAFFSGALAKSAPSAQHGNAALQKQILAQAEASAKRVEFVTAVRVYRFDGTELYPGGGPSDIADTRQTLQRANLWSQRVQHTQSGDDVDIQWLPLVNDEAVYVLAIDLSRAQMASNLALERRSVLQGMVVAFALIALSLLTLATGASRELERRRRQAETTFVQTLELFAATIDCRDPYTAGHSRRVADYARALAQALGLPPRECDIIEHSSLLHDVGKIGVPDYVLLKPAALDANERLIIECHPSLGAAILESINGMEDIVPCVLHHHERIDGKGYPARLCGVAIPVGARIIAVADTFDAMTTNRPYRKALSIEVTVKELLRVAGTQLDAAFVATFVTLVYAGIVAPPAPASLENDGANRFGPRALDAIRAKAIGHLALPAVVRASEDALGKTTAV
jgi:HD-GYP domain-containing protein (c-di-GMP phosphodiesterase class II)